MIRRSMLALIPAPALIVAACGGGKPPLPPLPASGVPEGGTPALVLSPPPSGLPPMASMPPPGVAGSRKARKKADGALYACASAKPAAKDPAELVRRVGEACASASKMKPLGAMIRAQQADKDAHQEHKLRVEPNKCYRVVFATDENVRDAVIVMRDSAGDVVAESPGVALPEDGVVCFTTADEVTLLVGIGAGKGAYAAQVWSD
ncbi:MAG: hypothetical protein KF819_11200 [Labilithrix sp.]|nr:hypothetical protein [Labilithrix sp.]